MSFVWTKTALVQNSLIWVRRKNVSEEGQSNHFSPHNGINDFLLTVGCSRFSPILNTWGGEGGVMTLILEITKCNAIFFKPYLHY